MTHTGSIVVTAFALPVAGAALLVIVLTGLFAPMAVRYALPVAAGLVLLGSEPYSDVARDGKWRLTKPLRAAAQRQALGHG